MLTTETASLSSACGSQKSRSFFWTQQIAVLALVERPHLEVPETWQREVEEERDGQEDEAEDAADGVSQAEGLVEVPEVGSGAAAAVERSEV